ncbi:hypothetical protein HS048_22450 [Planomonospora sp. ID91781]|uniref:hypothetical protein n=1 Tax=Planomonospora sp. ID91781 TaxID=2738135 RepID=UPI0018C37E62|nr:hypothetical protein [Planomonospora sp. ID91781]MBG0823495.1 hypothetical protein [Planomonospora sp. ID91781]
MAHIIESLTGRLLGTVLPAGEARAMAKQCISISRPTEEWCNFSIPPSGPKRSIITEICVDFATEKFWSTTKSSC